MYRGDPSGVSDRQTDLLYMTWCVFPAARRSVEGGDGASPGGHASDRSPVRLFPQETRECFPHPSSQTSLFSYRSTSKEKHIKYFNTLYKRQQTETQTSSVDRVNKNTNKALFARGNHYLGTPFNK